MIFHVHEEQMLSIFLLEVSPCTCTTEPKLNCSFDLPTSYFVAAKLAVTRRFLWGFFFIELFTVCLRTWFVRARTMPLVCSKLSSHSSAKDAAYSLSLPRFSQKLSALLKSSNLRLSLVMTDLLSLKPWLLSSMVTEPKGVRDDDGISVVKLSVLMIMPKLVLYIHYEHIARLK